MVSSGWLRIRHVREKRREEDVSGDSLGFTVKIEQEPEKERRVFFHDLDFE